MTFDTHIHSTFSCDAKASLDAMCRAAVEKGLSLICFTEHFDGNPKDYGFGFFDFAKYSEAIERARDSYSGKIRIFKGLEFSEPHLYKKELDEFNGMDFDFILGSVHWVGPDWIGDKAYVEANSLESIYLAHYTETLKACEAGGFDSLAHIDFPKRYLKGKREPMELIDKIMEALVSKGISLELNSSPLRKGYPEYYPSGAIMEAYRTHRGKLVTIGSDAHRAEDIAANFDSFELSGLSPCYYIKRERIAYSV